MRTLLPVAPDIVDDHKAVDNWRALHVNSPTMGDTRPVAAAKKRLERAAIAWAEAAELEKGRMIEELKAASRGLRDAIAAAGRPA